MKKAAVCFIMVYFILLYPASVTALELIYSKTSDSEPWTPYIKELIIEALKAENSHEEYTLVPSTSTLVQKRSLSMLRSGERLDIFWTMTSREREFGLYVLRMPLLRGVLGQRFIIVRKEDEEKFRSITSFSEARQYIYGQGHDWPDADILEKAGIKVHRVASYANLIKMLDQGRFDAFPLGMTEIWDIVQQRPELNVTVDTHLAFSYRAPVFIFLNSSNKDLQNRLSRGFEIIFANGTFEAIFDKYFSRIIERGGLDRRIIFKLDNPYMSKETIEAMERYSDFLLVK